MQEALEKAVQHWNMVAPVVDTPKTPDDYEVLLTNLRDAIELVENRGNSPLSGLIKAMATAAQEYERNFMPEHQQIAGGALLALKYLIKLHGIKQSELKEIGSQGVVSEVLSGKRSLTIRHVRELSKKFNVSPNVFIDD
ncbi:helix-turn-helix domain-containing protein [Aliikangiella coralliicola]|uniref:Helix-turn-helix domain-containing protein n=1 Tax=Aliikangiella coralliicola TaxID=2592383 RepID=A0A545UEQ8_9GAMM|nr:helix-turn-helix domain-containing protein [Aliikangiella coralliicola]TQV87873.1 helix-turn-helix domain-containing protein [Aliikangiella coralliicola]